MRWRKSNGTTLLQGGDPSPNHPNHWVLDYDPDEAGLAVAWALGRWFAVWRCLEELEEDPELHWPVVRIVHDSDGSGDLAFLAV